MTASKNPDQIMFSKIAEGLDSTSQLVHALLNEIKDSEADFAAVKTELSILRENVKGLSSIVREGNGATSLMTQIALIQQKMEGIDKWIDSHGDKHQAMKVSFEGLEHRLDDIDTRLVLLEKFIKELEEDKKQKDKAFRESVHRERDLEHQRELSYEKVMEERQKFKIGLIAAIIIGVVTAGMSFLPRFFK